MVYPDLVTVVMLRCKLDIVLTRTYQVSVLYYTVLEKIVVQFIDRETLSL